MQGDAGMPPEHLHAHAHRHQNGTSVAPVVYRPRGDHLGDHSILPVLWIAFALLSLLLPFMTARLAQMRALNISHSPVYAITLLASGAAYWAVVGMQIIATETSSWLVSPHGLRLAWMVLTQTGFSLQAFAYTKLLKMWIGFSRGLGLFASPKLRVPDWLDHLVSILVAAYLFNFVAQLCIAGGIYDLALVAEEKTDKAKADAHGARGGAVLTAEACCAVS